MIAIVWPSSLNVSLVWFLNQLWCWSYHFELTESTTVHTWEIFVKNHWDDKAFFNQLLCAVPACCTFFEKRNALFSTETSKNTYRLKGEGGGGGVALYMP